MKAWELYPKLTERIFRDHAEAGMLGGPHDPDQAVRIAQMAFDLLAGISPAGWLAAAAGLCVHADRILECRAGRRDARASKEGVRAFVSDQLTLEGPFDWNQGGKFMPDHINTIVDAVLRHDDRNQDDDGPVLVALMDGVRLVNTAPDLIIRAGQFYPKLPAVDFVNLWKDPSATYSDPRSVLRDIVESVECLTPGTPFYVRTPKAREIAARQKVFFDEFGAKLKECLAETGFYPYPPELLALREKFAIK